MWQPGRFFSPDASPPPLSLSLSPPTLQTMPTTAEVRRAEISVGGVTRQWQLGEPLFFDDSLEHSVVFDAAATAHRTVLIVDLWHPGVSADMKASRW